MKLLHFTILGMLLSSPAALGQTSTGSPSAPGVPSVSPPGGGRAPAIGSPGVVSGNLVQVPVHVPTNVCGNTVNVIGLLNPAF